MDELIASYRISVRLYSKMKYIKHAVLVCWYCLAVYFWPYFIPLIIDDLITGGEITVEVLTSHDRWYGVTYQEDATLVRNAFASFSQEGKYPQRLWG